MKRLKQAVRHGVPVDDIEGGSLDSSLQHGSHSSTLQPSDSLMDRFMEDIASGRVLPLHRSIARTVHGLRISPLTGGGTIENESDHGSDSRTWSEDRRQL